jgi:hypothetical protein
VPRPHVRRPEEANLALLFGTIRRHTPPHSSAGSSLTPPIHAQKKQKQEVLEKEAYNWSELKVGSVRQ